MSPFKRFLCFFLLCVTSLAGTCVRADAPAVLHVLSGEGQYALGRWLQYAQDLSGQWQLADVAAGDADKKFRHDDSGSLSFGYVDTVYWLRLVLRGEDTVDTAWLLELSGLARSIDDIRVFVPEESGQFRQMQSGDSVPFALRPIRHHAILFPVTLPTGKDLTLYVRVKTNGTLQIPATLWSTAHYAEAEHNGYLLEGMFYGLLVIMICYNAFLFVWVRDVSYLHYVLYLASLLFFAISLKCIGFEYLWPQQTWWNNQSNLVFADLGIFCLLMFARSFLQTRQHATMIDRCIIGMMGLAVAGLPIVLFANHRIAASALSTLYLLSLLVLLSASWMSFRRGYKATRYYLLAWVGVFVCMLLWVLNSFGVIHSPWVGAYSFQFGVSVQVTLFSLALADRINLLQAEREMALKTQIEQSERLVSMAKMFEKFVPKQFLSRIANRGIEHIELGKAEDDVISVFFADIRGFTPLSEAMSPQQLLNFLNAYFTRMDRVIHHHHGFIDKFIGDAVMALFENPDYHRGAFNCVQAAVEMHNEVNLYNQHRARSGYPPIAIGIGINTGSVIIGTVGSMDRMDSTVLGDNVNVAARLQEMTKVFGVKILISEQTRRALGDSMHFTLRELGDVQVRGRQESVRLFEVLDADPEHVRHAKLATMDAHRRALESYRRCDWVTANSVWQECRRQSPEDTVFRYMAERCALLAETPLGVA